MKLPCYCCAAGWARYVLTWQMHLTDSKVRPSGSPGRDTSLVDLMTCPFPEHSSNCKFVGEFGVVAICLGIIVVLLNQSQGFKV
jgi:hypothetical protein